MLDALRVIGALLLVFFLPGIMLVQALFPRKNELDLEFDWLYRLAMGIGLSIVVTILVNFVLNALGVNPDTGMGYVTTGPITLSLISLTLVFFLIAWFRGAFPFMGRLHPALIRFPARNPRDEDIPHLTDKVQRLKHQDLANRKFALIKQVSKAERMMDAHSGQQKEYYDKQRKGLLAELSDVESEIKKIEKGMPVVDEIVEEDEDVQ